MMHKTFRSTRRSSAHLLTYRVSLLQGGFQDYDPLALPLPGNATMPARPLPLMWNV